MSGLTSLPLIMASRPDAHLSVGLIQLIVAFPPWAAYPVASILSHEHWPAKEIKVTHIVKLF